MLVWARLAGCLVIGYLCMKRSFAYLGVPPLFIGEVLLAAFLLLKPRVALGSLAASLLRTSPLNALGLALLVFVLYGVWQVGRGVLSGTPLVYTLKYFVFNYYTLYMFLGMWIALHAPDSLPRLVRAIAWVNGIYGLMYIVALRHVDITLPGSGIPLFSPAGGGAVAILGLLCFERDLRAVWPILVLNIMVTLAWQVRAEWLGLGLGIFAWGLLTGRLGRVVAIGMAGLAVLGMIELAGIRLVGHTGGGLSLSETLARAVAPIDLELAKELSPNAVHHAGTAEWRWKWWEQIWISTHSTPMLAAFGHGYGFDLFGLAPEEVRAGQADDIRTPHSVFYYALGYTGWVGVTLFVLLQLVVLRLLWRSFRISGQPAGVVWWVMGMAMASFEEGFETPYKAIPFYLLMGMAMAPALQARRAPDRPAAAARLRPLGAR
jgi:hypothetical protein